MSQIELWIFKQFNLIFYSEEWSTPCKIMVIGTGLAGIVKAYFFRQTLGSVIEDHLFERSSKVGLDAGGCKNTCFLKFLSLTAWYQTSQRFVAWIMIEYKSICHRYFWIINLTQLTCWTICRKQRYLKKLEGKGNLSYIFSKEKPKA